MQTADRIELVVALQSAADGDGARVGTKAAVLGRLARAGFAVPEGLVLTTRAAADALAGLPAGSTPAQVLAAPLPPAVDAAIAAVAEHFGAAVLAVRSSAPAEDLPEASYAGQYASVLGVRGRDALREAVRRCWASAYDDTVRAYRRGPRDASAIAVLVQRQVDADVAGVAFSANPVSGARDEVLVSAVPGLGDALVSGAVQPDEWTVRGGIATAVRVEHRALAAEQAGAVAEVARRIEAELGGPQDIEWAMAGGRLVVLQARPITALPREPVADLPPGTWVKDVEHYPEPFTELGASIAAPAVAEGLSAMFAAWGGLLDRMETRTVGGEAYARAVPPGGRDGAPPPWWVLALLVRIVPTLRRRMRAARTMLRQTVFARLLEQWQTDWQPELAERTRVLGAVDLADLDDRALHAHLGAAVDVLRRALHVHFHLVPLYAVPPHELVGLSRELLGWSEGETLSLLAGASPSSSEPTRALAAIAARIATIPAARVAVADAGADLADRLTAADPEIGAAHADWCLRYGARCINDDPGSPVFTERPWLLTGLLRDALSAHDAGERGPAARAAAAREDATARALAQLSGRPLEERERFDRVLASALRYYPLREETALVLARAAGLVRLAAVEAGRRLAARGELARAEDAVQLDLATLSAALAGPVPADLRERVAQAHGERAWVSGHPGPPSYGPPPAPPPDLRGLPAPARRLNAALLWAQPRGPQPPPAQAATEAATLHGLPAAPGTCTGVVRVVTAPADFGRLRRGEVLVAPTTDPAWSVLFGVAGALVTDAGGLLSHAAIVAREHAIPAVVGTGAATSSLRDGDLVTVDGAAGTVTRHQGGTP